MVFPPAQVHMDSHAVLGYAQGNGSNVNKF